MNRSILVHLMDKLAKNLEEKLTIKLKNFCKNDIKLWWNYFKKIK